MMVTDTEKGNRAGLSEPKRTAAGNPRATLRRQRCFQDPSPETQVIKFHTKTENMITNPTQGMKGHFASPCR